MSRSASVSLLLVVWIGLTSCDALPSYASDILDNAALLSESDRHDDLCLTPGCVKWASTVLARMDTSVKPCDNFYRFACGNFIKTTVIPDDRVEVDAFTIIRDKLQMQLKMAFEEPTGEHEPQLFTKVKNFYKDCMNTERIEKLGLTIVKDKIKQTGGWPLLDGEDWNGDRFKWTDTLRKYSKYGYNTNALFSMTVDTDLQNSAKRIIYIDVATFGLEKEFLKKGKDDDVVRAYYNFMVDVTVAFGADPQRARLEMKDVLDFEISLANHTFTDLERRNITRIYNIRTIGELEACYPSISWSAIINNLLPETVQVGCEEVVIITEPKYIDYLEETLKSTSNRTLANYLVWHMVTMSLEALTKQIQDIQLKMKQVVYGIKQTPPRWEVCVNYVKDAMANLVGAMYVRKYFGQESKNEILYILRYIQRQFEKLLETNDWMDDETKATALKKFKAMRHHIGYPDELLDDAVLAKTYGAIKLVPGEFLDSALSVNRFNLLFNNGRLREPVNKNEWIAHGDTATVNGYFNQVENALRFPAGILQSQFFDVVRPKYMNFGAFGSIVGHEMTHGFDDVGRQFDADGNLKEWWRDETKRAFLKRVRCFIDQYGGYIVPEVNMAINGERTQGENIADNGGAKEAYLAYRTWQQENRPEPLLPGVNHTQNQMFWITLAQNWCHKATLEKMRAQAISDIHPAEEFRVVGPLSNMKEFSQDFHCSPRSPMNPDNKCKVW